MYSQSSSNNNTSSDDHHHQKIQKRKKPSHIIQMPSSPTNNDDDEQPSTSRTPPAISNYPTSPFKSWGARHTLTLLGFLGFASSYSMRVNLSIAIVSMVNSSSDSHHNHGHNLSATVACPELLEMSNLDKASSLSSSNTSPSSSFPKFNWSGQEQGIILGSFFYGYVATQVPGGLLANRIGGKWVFGVGMLITALFSLVTPMAANAGMEYLVLVRIIQGLGEGVTNPSMHALLAQWVPPLERSMLGAFVYAGAQIGTVLALPMSGWLLGNDSGNPLTSGWPSVFFVFGGLGIVWFIFWAYFVHSSPTLHPSISVEELQYIQTSKGVSSSEKRRGSESNKRTPWKTFMTSGPVLAILVAQTGHGWGLYTLLTELPTYMDDVLHFDIKQNSYLSALPYFLMFVMATVSSIYADKLRASGWSTTLVRKIFNTIAHWIPAVFLVLAANTACNRTLTVSLITFAIGINGAAWASFQVNHIDLSPNHAAVLMGITNGFANLCGIGAPYVAGLIINEGSSVARWRIIFYIASTVYFIDNVVYLIFASGEEQPWNSLDSHNARKTDDAQDSTNNAILFGSNDPGDPYHTPRNRFAINKSDEDEIEEEDDDSRSPLLVVGGGGR